LTQFINTYWLSAARTQEGYNCCFNNVIIGIHSDCSVACKSYREGCAAFIGIDASSSGCGLDGDETSSCSNSYFPSSMEMKLDENWSTLSHIHGWCFVCPCTIDGTSSSIELSFLGVKLGFGG